MGPNPTEGFFKKVLNGMGFFWEFQVKSFLSKSSFNGETFPTFFLKVPLHF